MSGTFSAEPEGSETVSRLLNSKRSHMEKVTFLVSMLLLLNIVLYIVVIVSASIAPMYTVYTAALIEIRYFIGHWFYCFLLSAVKVHNTMCSKHVFFASK